MNLLTDKESVTSEEYLETYKSQILPESEKVFIRDFLSQLISKEALTKVEPQYPFIDSEGHHRQIDFAVVVKVGRLHLRLMVNHIMPKA